MSFTNITLPVNSLAVKSRHRKTTKRQFDKRNTKCLDNNDIFITRSSSSSSQYCNNSSYERYGFQWVSPVQSTDWQFFA